MDFSTVGGELCTETAGGYGKSSVKLVAADRNRHKQVLGKCTFL